MVLVLFDDILVYSHTMEEHRLHLKLVFQMLEEGSLYAKASKCIFWQASVEYLGRITEGGIVRADPSKLQCMNDWPQPRNVKAMRGFLGFLGLIGYYRKFIRNFGLISKPFELTRKGKFEWSEAATQAFDELKKAMVSAPMLQIPDFQKKFVVETDASYFGIGAVLSQDKHTIAYISKALSPKSLSLSVYEKQFLVIILTIDKLRPYLIHGGFVIRTYQNNLKYLLEQKISTPMQQKYMTKLLGYHYTIEYKKGKENLVANAFSGRDQAALECSVVTTLQPAWIMELHDSYEGDKLAQEAIAQCLLHTSEVSYFAYDHQLLRFK